MDRSALAPSHHARVYRRDGEFYANKRFQWGERVFERGDFFPWQEMGLNVYKTYELWVSVLLDCYPPKVVEAKPAKHRKAHRAAASG